MQILISDGLDKAAISDLEEMGCTVVQKFLPPELLREEIKGFECVIVRSATKITRDIIDGALETGRLKLIIRAGVGTDNIDTGYAKANGIQVENTPDASSRAVAELAIGHMFSLARYIHNANVTMRKGEWNKSEYKGTELHNKVLGLIGFGRIARETAKIASAIGMKILYTNRTGIVKGFDDYTYLPLCQLLENSDIISLHVPYDKQMGALLGQKEFESIKRGAYLINCSRGGVVDEDALLSALDSGILEAAALDVFSQEPVKNTRLYTHDKISMTPHIGASTREAQQKIGSRIVDIIKDHI